MSLFPFCEGVTHSARAAQQLSKGDGVWLLNDRPLFTYGNPDILSDEPRPLLTAFLAHVATQPVGCVLDVAGGTNGRALQDLIAQGLATRGLVTNFEDNRSEETQANNRLGHVDGDLIKPETWRKIEIWKDAETPKGFSAILSDPVAGLNDLPSNFYKGAIHTLMDWTAPGGALFVPVPRAANNGIFFSIARRSDVESVHHDPINALIVKKDA